MADPTDEAATLGDRMADSSRSVSERDLFRVTAFIYETLGNWYELRLPGERPSIDPADIAVAVKPSAQGTEGESLLDDGDTLATVGGEEDETEGEDDEDGESGDDEVDEDDDKADKPRPLDQRDGVFAASESLAQIALGRRRENGESWDDVVQQLEAEQRSSLASALWVGLATEPEARYPTIGQWRRAVDAALRSDSATATMLDGDTGRSRTVPMVAAAVAFVVVAAGAFLWLSRDGGTVDDAEAATTEPAGPTGGASTAETTTETNEAATTTDGTVDDSPASGSAGEGGDACSLVGPLGPITIDQVSDVAIVVAWVPSTESVNILLDGAFVDTVPPEAFRYVIERLPLSENSLTPATDYTVAVEPQSGEPSTSCATTLANPIPGSEALIGVTAPTGLKVVDSSATSITVGWDPRPGADIHNLYLDGTYIRFGDVGGSSTVGDETEFTFVDLEPDTTYEIGIRRIEGPNQSGLVSVTATTDPG